MTSEHRNSTTIMRNINNISVIIVAIILIPFVLIGFIWRLLVSGPDEAMDYIDLTIINIGSQWMD